MTMSSFLAHAALRQSMSKGRGTKTNPARLIAVTAAVLAFSGGTPAEGIGTAYSNTRHPDHRDSYGYDSTSGRTDHSAVRPGEIKPVAINAGPIWSNADAQNKCPSVCSGLIWNRKWSTTPQGASSVSICGTSAGVDIPIGAISNNTDAATKCPSQLSKVSWGGQWWTTDPGKMSVCSCNPPAPVR